MKVDLIKFKELLEKGKTLSEISEILSISTSTASRTCKKLGIDYKKSYAKRDYSEVDLNQISALVDAGYSATIISKELGISYSKVLTILKQLDKSPKVRKSKVSDQQIIDLHTLGYTCKEIAEAVQLSDKRIMSRIKELGLLPNKKIEDSGPLTDVEFQVLLGTLLGDSTLAKRNNKVSGSCNHCVQQEDYAKHKHNLLKRLCTDIRLINKYDARLKNPEYQQWYFYIKVNKQLEYFYNKLYVNSKKEVPYELLSKIEPLGLAIWFMDDGSRHKDGGYILCTNSYSEESLFNIQKVLKEKFNVDTSIFKSCNEIYVLKNSRDIFQNLIAPYIIKSMEYKLFKSSLNSVKQGNSSNEDNPVLNPEEIQENAERLEVMPNK